MEAVSQFRALWKVPQTVKFTTFVPHDSRKLHFIFKLNQKAPGCRNIFDKDEGIRERGVLNMKDEGKLRFLDTFQIPRFPEGCEQQSVFILFQSHQLSEGAASCPMRTSWVRISVGFCGSQGLLRNRRIGSWQKCWFLGSACVLIYIIIWELLKNRNQVSIIFGKNSHQGNCNDTKKRRHSDQKRFRNTSESAVSRYGSGAAAYCYSCRGT